MGGGIAQHRLDPAAVGGVQLSQCHALAASPAHAVSEVVAHPLQGTQVEHLRIAGTRPGRRRRQRRDRIVAGEGPAQLPLQARDLLAQRAPAGAFVDVGGCPVKGRDRGMQFWSQEHVVPNLVHTR